MFRYVNEINADYCGSVVTFILNILRKVVVITIFLVQAVLFSGLKNSLIGK
jgi:hypothetical protein